MQIDNSQNLSSFAIITPSYDQDFQRCQLLCKSISRFVQPPFKHYIVVEKRDLKLFSQLKNQHTEIIIVQDLLPFWLFRLPKIRKTWFSLKGVPVRSWIMQQISKIALSRVIDEEISVFLDSDEMFIRDFGISNLVKNNQVRFYAEPEGNPIGMDTPHQHWHQSASRLLGLTATPMPAPDYIADVITWKRENVTAMCRHIERIYHQSWFEAVSKTWHFSEYTLYGTYIDRVLQDRSGHYWDPTKILNSYYDPNVMTEAELRNFVNSTRPEHVAIMISAKAKIAVDRYASLLELE